MSKVLFWIIVVLVALVVARISAHAQARKSRQARTARPAGRPRGGMRNAPAEQMVRCAHCGIHLPRSEATLIGGHTWCSQEHAKLGVKQ